MYETIKKDLPKAEVVRRFTGLGYKKRSAYGCLDIVEKDKAFKRKKGSARPIEDFWRKFESYVYEGDWKAKNLKQLENKIHACFSNMDPKVVQGHFKDIIRRHGVQYLN
ncbi:hypothetical protein BpHYR1_054014 [Brachionus plicatilis]|uniref:Uncharacterized protein n=1 Tax=Brachionus plicatilis TaxID=10195 RepID=A0A3M7PUV8_BRAPC|nr:hypothetical protein BpHYR1_054014 [Brachionus plicatilis]